jgi:hypothetical protein
MGLGGRLHLAWISSAEARKFAGLVADFTEHVRSLGPNPLKDFGARVRCIGPQPLFDKKKPAYGPAQLDLAHEPQAVESA